MQIATPEIRACNQYALCVCWGFDADSECYVLRDGQHVVQDEDSVWKIDPAGCVHDALIVTLGHAMRFHLEGYAFDQIRNDLIQFGVDKEFADRVHYHLVDVTKEEWAGLKERIEWYRNDEASDLNAEAENSGAS